MKVLKDQIFFVFQDDLPSVLLIQQNHRIKGDTRTIFIEMKKGCTPISSFMGRFSDYVKRDKDNKEFLIQRWNEFLAFIEKDFVVACEEKEELNRHYDRGDLLNWQKKLEKHVV